MDMKAEYKKFYKRYFNQSSPEYQAMAKRFLDRMPNKLDELDADFVLDFIDGYAPATQKQFMIFFRKLFKHLKKEDEIEGIRGKKIKPTITVEDLYTKNEVELILKECNKAQDKAMVEVLYESACREGELVSMTIENLKWMKNDVVGAIVTGKTGTRIVYLYESVPSLRAWINHHPIGKGALWVKHNKPNPPLDAKGVYYRIDRFLIKAGITGKKRIVHLWRHTRMTDLARQGLTESELAKVAGWTNTAMAKVYIHLSQRDVEATMLSKVFGVDAEDEEDAVISKILTAVECSACGARNSPTNVRCDVCNEQLHIEDLDVKIDKAIASKLLEIASTGLEKQIEAYFEKQKKNEE